MKEHFTRIVTIQQAVVRGDLEDVREPARWLAEHQTTGDITAPSAALLTNMRSVAKRAADAKTLPEAANETAALVATCGNCHAALSVRPTLPPVPDPPAASGTAAHMLEHQHAVDLMYQGLVGPSDAQWMKGAKELTTSPLARNDLPRDPALTNDIAAAEARTHQLAEKALQTKDTNGRAAIYGDIIAGCGQCHGLHGRVWGPGVPK
jgi:cytochrome c553